MSSYTPAAAVDGPWKAFALNPASFTPVAADPPQYMKDSRGTVHCRGRATKTGAGAFFLGAGTPAEIQPRVGSCYQFWPLGGDPTVQPAISAVIDGNLQAGFTNAGAEGPLGMVVDCSAWAWNV